MTIQYPVIIWTVICFTALYLILRFLLFKPVLEVMDKRKEKTAALHEEENRLLRLAEEEREAAARAEEEKIAQRKECALAEIEKVHAEEKTLLDDAKKERISLVEDHRLKTEKEYEDDMKKASEQAGALAKEFLDGLYAG